MSTTSPVFMRRADRSPVFARKIQTGPYQWRSGQFREGAYYGSDYKQAVYEEIDRSLFGQLHLDDALSGLTSWHSLFHSGHRFAQ
jgi:hypothetical protein